MTDNQLLTVALASGPTMIAVLIGILINNSRLNDFNTRFTDLNTRFSDLNSRFNDLNTRMDDMRKDLKETWRAELHRVEEVLDARLKHIEERQR